MSRSEHRPAYAVHPSCTPSGRAVAQCRRVSVALLQQAPHGLTAREMREATGCSTTLTARVLMGHGQVNANMTHLCSKEKTRECWACTSSSLFALSHPLSFPQGEGVWERCSCT
jgi:hypothetical protein